MSTLLPYLQAVVGIGLVGYAVALVVQRVRGSRPWGQPPRERAPADDLRLVIDLAARLRDKGHGEAVAVCESLVHELLKPNAGPRT